MGTIQLHAVEKWYSDLQVIKGVDLQIDNGEFVIFVGPSGCGKSTLLRMISGLEEVTVGTIEIDGKDITNLPPSARQLAMVFQSYALYPHMSVRDNMAFGLKMAKMPKPEIEKRVDGVAKVLKLDQLLDRKPRALSGGQRQRVAIGRAIVREPKAFLFDEPLSNLDAALRVDMRLEIAKLHTDLGATMIYVTHDQVEAMTLADKIVVLNGGIVEQVGSPLELYETPANLFVAQFIGSPKMNVMPCESAGAAIKLPQHGTINAPGAAIDQASQLGIRPEHVRIVDPDAGHATGLVEVTEHLGADTFLYVNADPLGMMVVRAEGTNRLRHGDKIGLLFDEPNVHIFSSDGQKLSA